ncbi:MAG: hypothetical protein K6F63_06000 [Lachnospiraceae bacterium]|nr:hypothetical protein [Lachnospiraceae bacterium]
MRENGFFKRLGNSFRNFMYGRYGIDGLGKFILVLGIIVMFASGFVRNAYVRWAMDAISWALIIWEYFRIFSTKREKRVRENYKYYAFLNSVKGIFGAGPDGNYKYFKCPGCKKQVKVPKHHGKIEITCRNCGTKFMGYTGKRR